MNTSTKQYPINGHLPKSGTRVLACYVENFRAVYYWPDKTWRTGSVGNADIVSQPDWWIPMPEDAD